MIIEFDSRAIELQKVSDKAKEKKKTQDQIIKDFKSANEECLESSLDDDEEILYNKYKDKPKEEIEKAKQKLDRDRRGIDKQLEEDKESQQQVSSIQNDIKTLPKKDIMVFLSGYAVYQQSLILIYRNRPSL